MPTFLIFCIFFQNFSGTLVFDILFDFLDFLGKHIFNIQSHFRIFPILCIFMCNIWCSTFYIFFLILITDSYHDTSISVHVFSFLDFHDIFFFEDSNSFSSLLTIFNKHFMALLAWTVQLTFINCNLKYRVIREVL